MGGQIIGRSMKGKSKLGPSWDGMSPKTEDDEKDHVEENGTDVVSKAQGGDVADMLRKLKAKRGGDKEEKMEEEAPEEEMDAEAAEEEDEDEGKEDKRELMDKSFFNYVEDNPVLMAGVEQSHFLQEMVKSIGFSFAKLEDNLGYVFAGVHNDYVDFAKSVDGTFETLGKSLGIVSDTGAAVESHASQGDIDTSNVTPLVKGGFEEGNLTKEGILNALMKGFEDGHVSPQDIIKFETTGALSPNIQKSLGL